MTRAVVLVAVLGAAGCGRPARLAHARGGLPVEPPCFGATAWPEADALFHRDPHWAGGDDAYSIDLGGGRTLWLFGDSWIDPSAHGRRGRGATMIRNSIAVQTGADPSTAKIEFRWRPGADGRPASFFPEQGSDWFWPGDGVRLGRRLVLFLARVRATTGGLGFEVYDWAAVRVDDPDADPAAWRWRWLGRPRTLPGLIIGFGAVLRSGDHVYTYATRENAPAHPTYLVRWPVGALAAGKLDRMEVWRGGGSGWVPVGTDGSEPVRLFDGQSEFTVHRDDATGSYLALQTVGFGPADIAVRAAPAPEGPWSPARALYRPPEYSRAGIMIYAAKAHPELAGADLMATYATNTFDFARQVADTTVYFPRFVRLWRCR